MVVNGGLRTVPQAAEQLAHTDGVMLGREAYHNPYLLPALHRAVYGDAFTMPEAEGVVRRMRDYAEREAARGTPLRSITRHMMGLFHGQSGARAELSAYLSQIANDPVTPQAALWHLARQLFDRDRRGTGEYYAGIVIVEGLARHLGAKVAAARYVTRERLAELANTIADASADKLRAAASALSAELFGVPATTIVDAAPRSVLARAR